MKDDKRLAQFENKLKNTSKSIIEEAKSYLKDIEINKKKSNSVIDKIVSSYGSKSKMYEKFEK